MNAKVMYQGADSVLSRVKTVYYTKPVLVLDADEAMEWLEWLCYIVKPHDHSEFCGDDVNECPLCVAESILADLDTAEGKGDE